MQQRFAATFLTLGLAAAFILFVPALRTEADWFTATSHDTQEAYADYATAWPDGPHSAEAASREDDRAWQAAEVVGDITAYHDYLQAHVNGTHASRACYEL